MFDTFKNRLEISGTLSTVTALRIGAGRSLDPTSSDLPVMKDALGRPLIPGSSFKGAMRSRLESFLRGIDLSLAIDPNELATSEMKKVDKIKKELKEEIDKASTENKAVKIDYDLTLTERLIAMTDRVSRLFGSPWMAGKLQIQDLPVLTDLWFGQYQERDGVAIERDTETAADGRKYDFQVVPAGTLFSFKAIVENASDAELGLLAIGLNQFENEMIPLGGGNSRGLGVVKLDLTEMIWVNPANRQELLEYLQNLVAGRLQNYVKTPRQIQSLQSEWSLALINKLRSRYIEPETQNPPLSLPGGE